MLLVNMFRQIKAGMFKFLNVIANIVSFTDSADGIMSLKLEGNTLKNELTYNPATWAEWTKPAGVVGDATGLEITSNGSNFITSRLATLMKPSTKYGVLYNVINSNLQNNFYFGGGTTLAAFIDTVVPKSVGNQKTIITTYASITLNSFQAYVLNTELSGNKIKLKDICIFELPTGSQIESDFTNLTADQLAAKYPFAPGICNVAEYAGKNITNLISNGDFSNGTTGWLEGNSTLSASNNTLRVTGNGASSSVYTYKQTALASVAGKHIYVKAKVKMTNPNCTAIQLRVQGSTGGTILNSNSVPLPTQDIEYSLTHTFTLTDQTGLLRVWVLATYADAATANGKVMEVRQVLATDLTAIFEAGKEPSQEWCDTNLAYFNDSILSTDKVEFLSVGKNLINADMIIDLVNNLTYAYKTVIDGRNCLALLGNAAMTNKRLPITFKPNTQYTIQVTTKRGNTVNGGGLMFVYADGSSNSYVLPTSTDWTMFKVTSVAGKTISGLYTVYSAYQINYFDIDSFQLEEGTIGTPYEPYKEYKIDISLTAPLRSLPNGVKDAVGSDGVRINNIGKIILNGSENWTLWDTKTNTILFYMTLETQKRNVAYVCDKFSHISDGTVDLEGTHSGGNPTTLWLSILKSKLTTQDVAGFKAWLAANPVTIYYELATSTTEDTTKQLLPKSYSKGTLQISSLIPPNLNIKYPV